MNLPWVPHYRLIVTDDLPRYEANGIIYSINATASGWTIRVRPDWKDNQGLMAHELAHVQLNYLNWMTLCLLRAILGDSRWRLWTEARAYAIQTKYPNRDGGFIAVESAAELMLAPRYGFNLTREQAEAEIRKYV